MSRTRTRTITFLLLLLAAIAVGSAACGADEQAAPPAPASGEAAPPSEPAPQAEPAAPADPAPSQPEPAAAEPPPTEAEPIRAGDAWSQVRPADEVFGGPGTLVMAEAVATSGDQLLAAGWDDTGVDRDAVVWTSADGMSWSRVSANEGALGGGGDQQINAVVAGDAGFVAVGSDAVAGPSDVKAAVWTSPDGTTWTRVAHDELAFGEPGTLVPADETELSRHVMADVTIGGPGFVAVGAEELWFGIVNADRRGAEKAAAVWTSVNGSSWTRVQDDREVLTKQPAKTSMRAVAERDGQLVAVGFESRGARALNAAVWTSDDAHDWSRVPHNDELFGGPTSFFQMNDIVAGGPGFVAVGAETTEANAREVGREGLPRPESILVSGIGLKDEPRAAIWLSADGIQWQRLPKERVIGAADEGRVLTAVATGGPGLIAVGWRLVDRELDPEVWTSTDGSEWTLASDTDGAFSAPDRQVITDVIAAGPGVLAVGASGSLFDSRAAVWTSQ